MEGTGGEGLWVSGGVVAPCPGVTGAPPQVEESVLTLGKFHNVVKLVAFSPFRSAQSALENMNAVSEGERGAGEPGSSSRGDPRAALTLLVPQESCTRICGCCWTRRCPPRGRRWCWGWAMPRWARPCWRSWACSARPGASWPSSCEVNGDRGDSGDISAGSWEG